MIISRTPLRVSFFGGGSDFPQWYEEHGGAVLTTAIDKYIYVIVKKRFDDKIVLHYTKTEVCDNVDEIQHDYIREAMLMCGIEKGVEITTLADIPSEGTGLGSSSSLAVGLIHALEGDCTSHPEYLAMKACELEREILNKPIGVQDQYIAAYGGFRYIGFDKDGVHIITPHEEKLVNRFSQQKEAIRKLEENTMLFYTGITRQASEVLQEQLSNMEERELQLREIALSAQNGQRVLEVGDVDNFGRLLHTNWNRKRMLAKSISNPEIDAMYDKAINAGALGGKICGAGGGGFMLLYVPLEKQGAVREELRGYQELLFKFEPEGSKIIYED